jgi:hypothetical protein
MKKLIFLFLITLYGRGFAQQTSNDITRTYYYYNILNVENEQILQQVVNEITEYKAVVSCKYRIKPEKKMAEIMITIDEKPLKGEGDKGEPLPNVKKLIIDKGLNYNGFTLQSEKISN